MNIQQILRETVKDMEGMVNLPDSEVIKLLKMNLCLKANEQSYNAWKENITITRGIKQ